VVEVLVALVVHQQLQLLPAAVVVVVVVALQYLSILVHLYPDLNHIQLAVPAAHLLLVLHLLPSFQLQVVAPLEVPVVLVLLDP
jgi:hypothetical protein